MQQFDIVIIGNGILAYSTAFALITKDPTLKVAIIGPQDRPGSATVASGAMLGCFGEVTKQGVSSSPGKFKHKLGIKAAKMWPSWIEKINSFNVQNSVKLDLGTHIVLNAKSGDLDDENFIAIINCLKDANEPYKEIEPNDIPGLNPISDCRPLKAIFLPNEGFINPSTILNGLHNSIQSNKCCSIIDNTVTKIHIDNNHVSCVEMISGQKINAKCIVLAAGAYSQFLIDQIPELKFLIPPLVHGVGISIITERSSPALTHVIRTPNRAGACGLHIMPRDENHVYIGATNNVSLLPITSPRMGHINFLIQCAIEQIDQSLHSSKIINWTVGNRPISIDSYPLIGETSINGLWMLTGTYRDGLHYSPLFAQAIANQILGERSIFTENNIFTPERLPIQTMTKEQAIEEAVHHYISGAYEHAMKLPRIGWDQMFKDLIRTKIENIFKELDTDYVLTPDMLLMFDDNKAKHLAYFKEYFKFLNTNISPKQTYRKSTSNAGSEVSTV